MILYLELAIIPPRRLVGERQQLVFLVSVLLRFISVPRLHQVSGHSFENVKRMHDLVAFYAKAQLSDCDKS